MSKTIQSPVTRWPGSVELSDPLTFPQYSAFLDSVDAAREVDNASRADAAILPGIAACIVSHSLSGIPDPFSAETFPATPRKASAELIGWLVAEITKLITDADEIPE